MDPTLVHSTGASVTLRLAKAQFDPVLREVSEAVLVGHLGSPLRLETTTGTLRVHGPSDSGTLEIRVTPIEGGLANVRFEGEIPGWEPLTGELRERFLRAALRHCSSIPIDGYCHSLGFGRECDRLLGHSGNHLSVRGEPTAWTRDGAAPISFESRFVVEDLLDRIRSLESLVGRSERTSSATLGSPRRLSRRSGATDLSIKPSTTPGLRAERGSGSPKTRPQPRRRRSSAPPPP